MKRSPLKRTASLTRSTSLRASSLRARRPIKRVSDKRAAEREERDEVREAVFKRDGYRCQALDLWPGHACHGSRLTVHHRIKASAGGKYDLATLISICAVGNDAIEDAVGEERAMLKRVGLIA